MNDTLRGCNLDDWLKTDQKLINGGETSKNEQEIASYRKRS